MTTRLVDRMQTRLGLRREGAREPAPTDAELTDVLAAELEAGGRDPYRQVAPILHLYYVRGSR